VDSPYILWKSPLQPPVLSSGEIHVWGASLQPAADRLDVLAASLSTDESDRASRFHFPHHQRRFVAARGILRSLLATYLEVSPREIQFKYGAQGKPELASDRSLYFNVSHSEELAVYAVCSSNPVGVDVELLRETPDFEEIASRFFTESESSKLRSLPPEEKMTAFFRCWTRKEAVLKACGDGIGGGLDTIEVSLTPEATISQINHSLAARRDWHLQNLAPAVGYVGAIAAPTSHLDISVWQFDQN
jgi:4'-phosphopantetheinyl transferase